MDLRELEHAAARHPWESARLSFVLAKLSELAASSGTETARVLDVGCGDGYVARAVQQALPACSLVAVDTELPDDALAPSSNGLSFVNRWDDVADGAFDLALLLDVIEHVEDDNRFMRQVLTKMRRPAQLLVTVPAFSTLFSSHDRFLGHYRRHNRRQLLDLLGAVGLQVQQSGYLFLSPILARCGTLALERTLGAPDEPQGVGGWRHGRLLTGAMHHYLRLENRLLDAAQRRSLRLPGLSAWALCSR